MPELLEGNAWLQEIVRKHPYAEAEQAYARNLEALRIAGQATQIEKIMLVLLLPSAVSLRSAENLILLGNPMIPMGAGAIIFDGNIPGRLHLDPIEIV